MVSKTKRERIERRKKDKKWSIDVKKIFGGKCAFCNADSYIQAHHIIPREIKEFRYNLINGISLCTKHHKWGKESAHSNPMEFFIKLEEDYPKRIKLLKKQYRRFRKVGKAQI